LQILDKNKSKCRTIDKAIRSTKKHNVFKLIPEKQLVVSMNQSIVLTSTSTKIDLNRFKSREGEIDLHTMFLYWFTHNLSYIQSQNNLWKIHYVINNKLQQQTHQKAYCDTFKTTHPL